MSDSGIHIYRATKGHYGAPIPFPKSGIKFVDEDTGRRIKAPTKIRCEHSRHFANIDDGRRWSFRLKECFVQKWEMSKKELNKAVEDWDFASLDMRARIICPWCARKEG